MEEVAEILEAQNSNHDLRNLDWLTHFPAAPF